MNIRILRKSKGLSQMKLAFLAGISRHRLYMYENGYLKLTKNETEKLNLVLKNLKPNQEN